jgi:hypothetical protein
MEETPMSQEQLDAQHEERFENLLTHARLNLRIQILNHKLKLLANALKQVSERGSVRP